LAAVTSGGFIYVSTDYGKVWTAEASKRSWSMAVKIVTQRERNIVRAKQETLEGPKKSNCVFWLIGVLIENYLYSLIIAVNLLIPHILKK
jgi:hypothetical protein